MVSTLIISVPYTTTPISQVVSTAISTSVSLVPTTIVSTYISTSVSTVPTTILFTVISTSISTVPTTVVTTTVSLSTSTLVATVDQTRYVTATTAIPTTVVSSYISTTLETVYFPSVATATSLVVSTVFFPTTTTSISLVPTTVVSTSLSSYPVTTILVQTATSLVPTTLVTTYITTETATETATETTVSSYGVTATETTSEVSTQVTTERVTATPSVITLPNNLGTQFGGVDVTKGFANPNFIRPGLFNLGGLPGSEYDTQTVYYGATEGQWTYHIPEFLGFTWASQLNTETVTGETKSENQRSLSEKFSANIGFAGFGLEIQHTFEETTNVETFHKYASLYARQQIYRVSVREFPAALQSYLSERALRLFREGDPKAIVDTFGTHYMTSASFGGMRRFASTLDVRDEGISTKLGQALKMKFAVETEAGEVSGGAGNENTDATVQKIHNQMDVKNSIVFGRTYVEGKDDSWIPSLYRNPSAIDFELASLSDLILDPAIKAAVQAEIASRMSSDQVTSNAQALVMWESLRDKVDDAGSGAHNSWATATVNPKQGWFTLGQYGLSGEALNWWSPTRSKGLLIRNIPGSNQQLIRRPDDIDGRWGHAPHYGLYEMISRTPGYYALSGFYYRDNHASFQLMEQENPGMVHESLTLEASDGGELWNDSGSGVNQDARVHWVNQGPPDDDSIRILQIPDGQPQAYFFHTWRGDRDGGGSDIRYRRLDFSKVQFVSNNFINPA